MNNEEVVVLGGIRASRLVDTSDSGLLAVLMLVTKIAINSLTSFVMVLVLNEKQLNI